MDRFIVQLAFFICLAVLRTFAVDPALTAVDAIMSTSADDDISAIPSTSANSIATVKICEAFTELKNEVILITRDFKNNNKDIFKFHFL